MVALWDRSKLGTLHADLTISRAARTSLRGHMGPGDGDGDNDA